ncbi:MAG: cellulose-binding protein [Symploca sp. SIO1A3]|nr:cellulose-binding protein [Symploca sp. SIO1A3]
MNNTIRILSKLSLSTLLFLSGGVFLPALENLMIADSNYFGHLAQSNEASPVVIVLIGDSITQGNWENKSWRYNLWTKLMDAEIAFDFVGSLKTNFKGTPDFPDYKGQTFDRDHEARWGWRTDEILEQLDGWMNGYPSSADIALIQLGHNDLDQGQTPSSTVNEISQIIDKLRAKNPNVVIFLGQSPPEWEPFPSYRAEMAAFAPAKSLPESPVILVDHQIDWISDPSLPGAHTYDGVHPGLLGEEKLAQAWFEALLPYLP